MSSIVTIPEVGIVRFSNISAIDIIQPRINIIAVSLDDDFEHLRQLIIEHGYSRLPVYHENLDNIVHGQAVFFCHFLADY